MVFTIKKPSSKRFFQMSFEGFRPSGKNRLEQFFNLWREFLRALSRYVFLRLTGLLLLLPKLVKLLFLAVPKSKQYVTKKLIWSRGRLGRPIATGVVVGVAMLVFMLGEVFSGSTLVVDQEPNTDYLVTTTDIIPKKEIALTTVPEVRKRSESFTYVIEPGDSLYSIGVKFKISSDALKYVNNLSDYSILKVGQQVSIPPINGLVHKVKEGDTLTSIANTYAVPVQSIADFNYLLDTTHLALGTELVIPGAKIPEPVIPTYPVYTVPAGYADVSVNANKNYCVWPSTVRIITQYYSWYHNGVDIAKPFNIGEPPLLACNEGVVTRAGWDPFGLGLHVRIVHPGGFETIYGHMSRLDVSYGDKVRRGQVIGLMGSTGNSTGPHVHFIVKYKGVVQNPLSFTQ